jgi:hypothetical protein
MPGVPPPLLLVVGDTGHGVAGYARDVAIAVRNADPRTQIVSVPDAAGAARAAASAPRIHLHVTERIFGGTPEAAAEQIDRIAAATSVTVTLHDVPQSSDGTPLARRISAYDRILAVADAAVVNSGHEAALVREHLAYGGELDVIPLGTRDAVPPRLPAPTRSRRLEVAIAGFVYPGKGHAPALRAAADAARLLHADGSGPEEVAVRAIGGPSPGHEADLEALRAEGDRLGVTFAVTGFLEDEAFAREIRDASIPLAAHEHVSASRSILDWGEAGRRPLVVRSRYAEEMAALRPGTLTLYDPDALAEALAAAWHRPASTVLDPGVRLTPDLADVAVRYLQWWAAR